jgi:hypothetical protein
VAKLAGHASAAVALGGPAGGAESVIAALERTFTRLGTDNALKPRTVYAFA